MPVPDQPIRIAVFNHKGGVGKTTISVNLAAAIAEKGHKILLLDSDPQCNLSSQLFDEDTVDSFLQASDSERGETVWSALRPISRNEPWRVVEPQKTTTSGCYVIPGDIRLSQFELDLADYWGDCKEEKFRGFSATSAIHDLATSAAKKVSASYIFYDTGPNIGPLNRAILLGCDWFIVPGACDLFSVRALKTLGQILCLWIRTWKKFAQDAPSDAPVLSGMPKYLGYIPQRFRVYGNAMTRVSSHYRARFETQLLQDVLRPLRKVDTTLAPEKVAGSCLGEVKEFTTLVQQSQEQGMPLWRVYGGIAYQLEEAKRIFSDMADHVIHTSS